MHRGDPFACPDVLFVRTARGYGIPVRDGGSSHVAITHCPFCGDRLPDDDDPDQLHRDAFEATAYDPDPTACPECGCPAACCICGDKMCPICNCQPCDCNRDDEWEDGE
jgi:hypothetical protein